MAWKEGTRRREAGNSRRWMKAVEGSLNKRETAAYYTSSVALASFGRAYSACFDCSYFASKNEGMM